MPDLKRPKPPARRSVASLATRIVMRVSPEFRDGEWSSVAAALIGAVVRQAIKDALAPCGHLPGIDGTIEDLASLIGIEPHTLHAIVGDLRAALDSEPPRAILGVTYCDECNRGKQRPRRSPCNGARLLL